MTADTARSYNGGDKSAMGSARTSRRHSARLTVVDEQQADQYDKGGGVRIGDVVSLRAAELPGALVSDGFVDLACYVEDVDAAPGAQAFLAPLFVVCVHHTYAAREAYAAALAIDLPAAGYLQMGERRAVLEKQATNAASERLSNVHDEERHMKSGAYLTSRPRNASSTEADQVFMAPQPSQTAGFAIEPRFKIQSHGEVLCYGDCTTLALDKNPSLFIRADAPPADYSAIPDPQRDFARPEIHARSRLHVSALCLQFSWRFERYASSANVSPTFRPRCEHVLGGDVVRLVHKESDTQLALRRVGGTQRGSAAHAGY
ncbi:hypothetical protein T484DRAFT_1789866 [Baffinella frigidus]|nr:hypothetical protein T484DRAFT_1789866 [Cryptophyta sp. CCMP2293]